MANEHAVEHRRQGVYADHRLTVEILGNVGNQAILSDYHHHVFGLEQEPVELFTHDEIPTIIKRNCRLNARDSRPHLVMNRLDGSQVLAALLEKKLRLAPRRVTRKELLVGSTARHYDHARR